VPTFPENAPAEPIPLTVLTGFLGAGKTSLLNRLVTDPALAETAVIINEFGEVGLDHLLVKPISDAALASKASGQRGNSFEVRAPDTRPEPGSSAHANVVLLQSGCLCCTMRGDLVDALEQLLRDLDNGRAVFRRVILETTGLADPAPVLQTAMAHPYLVMRYRLDGVITVVDAVNGDATLDAHLEAVKQVAVADRIVLSKTDLPPPYPPPHAGEGREGVERRRGEDALLARLRALNPAAPILDAAAGEATPARLLACGLYDPERKIPDVARWLAAEAYAETDHHHHHDVNRHDDRIRAFAFTADGAIPSAMLEMFLDLLRSVHGPNLLRLKGIVKLAETPASPVVIHGVQHVFHPAVRLPHWPDGDERTRIVLITRDLEPEAVKHLFDAFLGAATPDRADRAALLDNPLVPFGGLDR
jgi:G3E family GTPase